MDSRIRNTLFFTGSSCLVLVAASLASMALVAAVAKIAASTGFITVAALGGAMQSAYGRTLLVGLVLSFIGDASLIGNSRDAFLGGLTAFLLAHVAYIAAFSIRGIDSRWMLFAAMPIALIAIVVGAWLSPHIATDMRIPVYAYISVISAMLIAAVGTRGKGGTILIVAGALLFFLSDLSVALQRLVQADFPHYVWGLPFYYAGQLCLAVSASQSRSH